MKTTKKQAHENYHRLEVKEIGENKWEISCYIKNKLRTTTTRNVEAIYNWQCDPEEMEKQFFAPPRNRKLAGYDYLVNEIIKSIF